MPANVRSSLHGSSRSLFTWPFIVEDRMNLPMGILVLHPEDAIGVLARTIMALPLYLKYECLTCAVQVYSYSKQASFTNEQQALLHCDIR